MWAQNKFLKMDLSLDEIIQRKNINFMPQKRNFNNNNKTNFRLARKDAPIRTKIIDARQKINQKNRTRIRDARERLTRINKSNDDARARINNGRGNPGIYRNGIRARLLRSRPRQMGYNPMSHPRPLPALPTFSPTIEIPRGYIDYDKMDDDEEDYVMQGANIKRTVYNNTTPVYSAAPSGLTQWRNSSRPIDPFDCYEVPSQGKSDNFYIRREIRELSPDIIPRKGILRSDQLSSAVPYLSSRYNTDHFPHLSYEMRNRLEHAPNPHASMGIFANSKPSLPSSSTQQLEQLSSSGYRIVVSNLHETVSQNDVKELFEDIGQLYDARLVRPGVAQVIFKSLRDAEKAVETYHNRQLDGLPMKCLLVKPRISSKPTAPAAIKPINSFASKSTNKTPLEIDIDALHKVLFRRK